MATETRRIVSIVATALIAMVVTAEVQAADPCAGGGRLTPALDVDGIGGTGRSESDPDSEGIGGTGLYASENVADGIGGTGRGPGDADDPDEGGIGGTGIDRDADAGIVGIVTGFASICVGGREIHYDAQTAVSIDGTPSDAGVLAVGQIVEVAARGNVAVSVGVRHEVEGELTAVDLSGKRLTVLGQEVVLTSTTWTDLEAGPALAEVDMFEVGDHVRVGGFRDQSGALKASRVEALDQSIPGLRGPVQEVGTDFAIVAGVRVRMEGTPAPRVGETVRLQAKWQDDVLLAQTMVVQPALPFGGRIEKVHLEGIVTPSAVGGQVVVDGVGIVASGTGQTLQVGRRVRIETRIRNGIAVAERIEPLRPRVPPRRTSRGAPVGGGAKADVPAAGLSSAGRARPRVNSRNPGAVRARPAPRGAIPARIERPQRPAKAMRPERPERPERPQRPERPELPQRPIRPQRPPSR